ncbi:ABC transporter permease/substrate-binding protein [Massilia antarctica]|uniref:ABC transporter permease/substrate-binding protein n=1 Tax=Massilia antarctica TaxID=2765360 RepID=UPI0006BDAF7B|nr:ABC transporter permease subunit [Massilia sp. H27-R4]CUI09568.1 L-proline glycine betaine binding ABC transporter protein ProX (TC 3.A.1.12.1) / Osmotic adaptation [Janthinobacterium sp. CG23_2]CUU33354.1 L-proline glycine betaine binding ABC transporter protein ProX (TC 3.A.1.12.1) / Osmotic adaptation [Janthinobacterium sp. CG23_2]
MRTFFATALRWLSVFTFVLAGAATAADAEPLRVGSKRFTESYILGEVLTQTAAAHGARAEHRQGLGNTAIVLAALQGGSIDVYPEYMGTIDLEILKNTSASSLEQMRAALKPMGLGVALPLGFNNTYALAMRGDSKGIDSLSDLARQPALKLGLSHEFIGRADGWPGLKQRYGLPHTPRGLDHGIAYEALAQGQVDVIDIYSTDAKIRQYGLRVLKDDLGYFPRYDAMLLYRLDAPQRFPKAWAAIAKLEGRITAEQMIAMNAQVELEGKSFAAVAKNWLTPATAAPGVARAGLVNKMFDASLWTLTRQHVVLVLASVVLACLVGIPLGIVAAFAPRLRQTVLALAGMLQTVPSLALLAILIPLLGMIGTVPALVALFVYALLPIVRNTCTGLLGVPQGLRTAAQALGLDRRATLVHVELPLALPVILAGIKTAAVMSVGTATIAAFIGAGGFGERITIGLALNDNDMLLAGAIPAALLALLTQGLFEAGERLIARRR